MTKPFSLLNEIENEDGQPYHLKKSKIISLLKNKFDFRALASAEIRKYNKNNSYSTAKYLNTLI